MGPAGQLFDQCLKAASIARRDCYILNVFPFPVHKKRDNEWYSPQGECVWLKGLTKLGVEAVSAQMRNLYRSEARVFVPMGAAALHALTAKTQVMKWRGSILEGQAWGERHNRPIKVVPTIHPSASLRGQYLWRYMIIGDLRRAREESLSPEINLPKRELIVRPTYREVLEFLEELRARRKPINFDIEIYNHQISCISFANSPERAISVPFMDESGNYWPENVEADIWMMIAALLGDPGIANVNQNVLFDMAVLAQKNGIITRGPCYDPMVAQSIMYPEFPKGLDFICSVHTREPYYKDEGKIWQKIDVTWDDHWRYNAKDSVVSLEAWQALAAEMDAKGYREIHDQTTRMYPALLEMMLRGMKVDRDALATTQKQIKAEIAEKLAELHRVADYEFNPTSPKQCQEYFYGHKDIPPYMSRKTGKPTTDDKAMSRIVRRFKLPEAKLVQEIRGLSKLEGTYLEIAFDPDDRLRCSYNPRGTWTGRLSTSQTVFGTGTNMQNLDPRFKEFLVAG